LGDDINVWPVDIDVSRNDRIVGRVLASAFDFFSTYPILAKLKAGRCYTWIKPNAICTALGAAPSPCPAVHGAYAVVDSTVSLPMSDADWVWKNINCD
jgi:hypothetical protein